MSRLFNPHLLRAHEARLVGAARRGPSGMQQYTPRGLADKVKSLSQSKVWWAEATLALNASDEAMKAAVWNATDEDAIALVNKLLQRSGKCAVYLVIEFCLSMMDIRCPWRASAALLARDRAFDRAELGAV